MNVTSSVVLALGPEDIKAAIASYVNRRWSHRIAVFVRPEEVKLIALLGGNLAANIELAVSEAVTPEMIDG